MSQPGIYQRLVVVRGAKHIVVSIKNQHHLPIALHQVELGPQPIATPDRESGCLDRRYVRKDVTRFVIRVGDAH